MSKKTKNKAQAISEFALLLPMVLLLIFGVLEFGRAFHIKIVLENAAREGAHFLIYAPDDPANNFTDTILAVVSEAANSGVTITTTDVVVHCYDSLGNQNDVCPGGSTAEIIVSNEFTPAIFGFVTGSLTMQSNARMLIP